ncbi:hypothetical protein V5T82_16930 [Magnetovibrio sp. PR-2]|uniref:hypothetical protein n=1 Tax=Magnetovibrio sp. PR-2 TaxID=3120356 RepID=UPI002FCE0D73
MRIEPLRDEASIVLRGAFNPRIFHPAWLELNSLISKEQAEDADIEIIHADITRFTAGYITFEIQANRFMVGCEAIYKDLIKDMAVSIFGEHLVHSQIWQLGLNRTILFSCGNEATRDAFGSLLAPKEHWGKWGDEIKGEDAQKHGGMIRMAMRQQPRPDGIEGYIDAEVRAVKDDHSAVELGINNHFSISDPENTTGCTEAIDVLHTHWSAVMEKAEFIADGLMETIESVKQ